MKFLFAAVALAFGLTGTIGAQSVACAPAGYTRAELATLKQASFAIPDSVRRQTFALDVANCLADPDPAVRDGIAF